MIWGIIMAISPNEDDVLLMPDTRGIVPGNTFRVEVLQTRFNNQFKGLWRQWLDGLPCQLLSAKTGGWRKGKIQMMVKISFVFTPDENE